MATKMLVILALFITLLGTADAIDPPSMDPAFQVAFDETFIEKDKKYVVNGQMFYDAKNNRERVDRNQGQHDLFCGTVLPNISTPCSQITVNNKRYINFPKKKICCFCCDSEHGCGILRQDWLNGAQYKGTQKLIDTQYDKWQKDGDFGYNYFYVTTDDAHIPRRLNENGDHITDYIVHSYKQKQFDDTYFALPSNCTNSCSLSSICGKLRGEKSQTMLQSQ